VLPSIPDARRCRGQSGADGDGVFKTYRIESLNSNKIGFEADIAQFQRALKVATPVFPRTDGAASALEPRGRTLFFPSSMSCFTRLRAHSTQRGFGTHLSNNTSLHQPAILHAYTQTQSSTHTNVQRSRMHAHKRETLTLIATLTPTYADCRTFRGCNNQALKQKWASFHDFRDHCQNGALLPPAVYADAITDETQNSRRRHRRFQRHRAIDVMAVHPVGSMVQRVLHVQ